MPVHDELLAEAFGSREWREAADALFEATGLVVGVMDASARSVIHSTPQCVYCQLAVPTAETVSDTCFDDPPEADELVRGGCRGGLPCYVAPIEHEGKRVGTVVIGGFVAATRERKRLFEKLLGRGVAEQDARGAVRQIPVMPKREVEAYVRMVVAQARAAIGRAAENQGWESRMRELEVFAEAGQEFTIISDDRDSVLDRVLSKAMSIVHADSGTLMLLKPGTDILEVVVARGESSKDALGQRIHVGEGIAGRVAQTRRGVLITGERDTEMHKASHPKKGVRAAVAVPLVLGERVIGVINASVASPTQKMSGEALTLLERFAAMGSRVIDSASKNRAQQRAVWELMHLGEYAKVMSTTSDLEDVETTTASILEKAFDFDVGGIVVTGWGRDHAAVNVVGEVPRGAIDHVIAEAAGWDLHETQFPAVKLNAHRGSVVEEETPIEPDDWMVMSVEIMVRETIVGYLFVSGRGVGLFDSDDRRLLTQLADHAASALEKTALFSRLRDDYAKTIAALSATLDAGEHASRGHSDRVMDYAVAIGEEMELDRDELEVLRFAGLLHDVGKLGVAEEILLKPSNLTEDEMDQVRAHAQIGASILEQIEFLDAITPVVLHHHERWDGEGYPGGLTGPEIPKLARILAVADSFDAMTSERSYRERLSFREARDELRSGMGTQFDPKVVKAFFEAMDRKALAGATGLLADTPSKPDQLPA